MDSPAGWCRRRTEVQTLDGSRPRVQSGCGTRVELEQVEHAAINVSADVVWVVCLECGRCEHVTVQDSVPEVWREALHLGFDGVDGVALVVRRHMTVRPNGLDACVVRRAFRKSRRIEQ